MNSYITLWDYILVPFVLMIVYAIAYRFRDKHYPRKHPYRKYFIPALTIKIIGAIFIGLIYQYYYGGGDTFNFFTHAKIINSAFTDSPVKWLNLISHNADEYTPGYYPYISQLYWYDDKASYMVCSITALLSLPFGTTYLPTAIIFGVLSFTGIWAMFRTFAAIYPRYLRQIAIAMLYIPSVALWGSGIFKDTVCMFSLGWLVYGVFQMLIKRNFSFNNILLTALAFYLTYKIKLYILMAFIPALLIWILFLYTSKLKSTAARISLNLSIFGLIGVTTFLALSYLGEDILGKYSLDNIDQTASVTRGWIHFASGDEGASYDLGDVSSPALMIAKFPLAVNVTLFRPYIWEARKVMVFLSSLEALLFLLMTIKIFYTIGFKKVWRTIATDSNIQFCLIFSFIFAFAVGISSYNFGALSRYKIPCEPFYALAMFLIYYKNAKKPLLKILNL